MKTAFYARTGTVVKIGDDILRVVKHTLKSTNKGRGKGFLVQMRLKNLITGSVIEEVYDSEDKMDDITLERAKAEFLYESAGTYAFMNQETYEQTELSEEDVGDAKDFLIEGQIVDLQQYEGQFVGIVLPLQVKLRVTECEPGVKGNTADGRITKDATLETGYVVKVPGFIETGDELMINTETGEYTERAKD
ncbi:MAG TPA: elongation factor P [bacterium]|nr:elongation factor P [bacterium]